jgi:fatty acyl-CoA reductase
MVEKVHASRSGVSAATAAVGGSIVDRLAGKTLLLTGVTGFLGQVVLERLLMDFPQTRIVLLVRSQTGATARERVEYLLRKPAFTLLRERYDDQALMGLLDERTQVVDGDFSRSEPAIPAGIDVAIHSAATVSFDPPIDEAFQTNLIGALNLYRGVLAAGSRPAFVHISTAYVAGVQKGVIPEGPLEHRVDYRLEGELALAARADV